MLPRPREAHPSRTCTDMPTMGKEVMEEPHRIRHLTMRCGVAVGGHAKTELPLRL